MTSRRRLVLAGAAALGVAVGVVVVAVVVLDGDPGGDETPFSLDVALSRAAQARTIELDMVAVRAGTEELVRELRWDAENDIAAMTDTVNGRLSGRHVVDATRGDVFTDTASAFGGESAIPQDWFLMDDAWGPSTDAAPLLELFSTSLSEVMEAVAAIETVAPLGRVDLEGVDVEQFELTVPADLIERSALGFGQRLAEDDEVDLVISVSEDSRVVRIEFDRWDLDEPRLPLVVVTVDVAALDEPSEVGVPDESEVIALDDVENSQEA
jgi:hypothetical protein